MAGAELARVSGMHGHPQIFRKLSNILKIMYVPLLAKGSFEFELRCNLMLLE